MTPTPRAGRLARALFVVALCGLGAARADDDSEAEKLAAEEAGAEKASAALKDEAAKAFEELRPKLEYLGGWCGDFEQFLERARIADVLLAFDADDAKAREWLGFKRMKNGAWKPGAWHAFADGRPESQAEFVKRRADVAAAFRARFFPFLDRCRDWTTAGLRDRIVRSLVDLFPDDETLREIHGETLVKGKWVLRESAETVANREKLSAALTAARAEAAKVARRVETNTANGWETSVATDELHVMSELSVDETQSVATSALAAQILFSRALQADAHYPPVSRLYLLANEASNVRFLADQLDVDPVKRARYGKMRSYWLRSNECVEVRTDSAALLDSATRQMLSVLKGPGVQLYDAPPWLGEGAGMYFVYKLLGTHKTAFIETGAYSDDAIGREVAAVDADWLVVARKLVDKGYALDVPVLTGLPINSMTKDDGLMSYALAAYFIEGRPKDTAALLAALGNKGEKFHRALAEICGVDAEALQCRFVRWMHEIPAK